MNDTIWQYRSDGSIEVRIEVWRDTVLHIAYGKGAADTSLFHVVDYFHHGAGMKTRSIIVNEPVPANKAITCFDCEGTWYYIRSLHWFGARIIEMSASDGERNWEYDDWSPVPLPKEFDENDMLIR